MPVLTLRAFVAYKNGENLPTYFVHRAYLLVLPFPKLIAVISTEEYQQAGFCSGDAGMEFLCWLIYKVPGF